jgi:tetratricopeptide (TPR) repeat protein
MRRQQSGWPGGAAAASPDCVKSSSCVRADDSELLESTRKALGRGDLVMAEACARSAIELNAQSAHAWESLGTVLATRGDLAAASDCYQAAARIDPTYLSAVNNLAVVLQRLERFDESEQYYLHAIRLAPDHLDIKLNFASLLAKLGRYRDALAIAEEYLCTHPVAVNARLFAAAIECEVGNDVLALAHIDRVLAATPGALHILVLRARILCRLGRFQDALIGCDFVLARHPDESRALHAKALALQGLDRTAEALEAFDAAASRESAPAAILVDRAWLLAETGYRQGALSDLEKALELDPGLSAARYRRALLTDYTDRDSELQALEDIADTARLPSRDRMLYCFALGRARLTRGEGEHAFARLDAGNRLKRDTLNYDASIDAQRCSEIITAYSAKTLSRLANKGFPSARPVFVFGMPRSGTTLIEQILASHPMAHGAGESVHLRDIAEAPGFPARGAGLSPDECLVLGRQFVDRISIGTSDAQKLVDKMPLNFLHAGLISLILPQARMIHCRRDPLDTCLSIYSLLFDSGHQFAYDQVELGQYYNQYRRLMAHWRHVLPGESLLEVDYENLVRDTETEVRKILEFCRLPWDPGCLEFYRTNRRVSSSSLNQVRSPIYADSVGIARKFRPWLTQLETELTKTHCD